MRLGLKIFWSILLISVVVYSGSVCLLLWNTHQGNLNREQERAISEFDLIGASIDQALENQKMLSQTTDNLTKEEMSGVVERFASYYKQKGILLGLADGTEIQYTIQENLAKEYPDLLSPPQDCYRVKVGEIEKDTLLFVAANLSQSGYTLLFARDISEIYDLRTQSVQLFIGLGVLMVVVLAIAARLVSASLVKPLVKLQKGAENLAKGKFVLLQEGVDEIGKLAHAFNCMAEAVEKREQSLKEQVEIKQTFIDDLSHEMNTPLTSIQGYAALLETANCTPSQQQKATTYIQHEAKRLKNMYQKLRVLSITGSSGITWGRFSVLSLFDAVVSPLETALSEYEVQLALDEENRMLSGDLDLVIILVSNLLRNAMLYSEKHSTIRLSAWGDEDGCYLSVSDQGKGIPIDKQQKIFEPFYRVDKSRSRQTGGTGLGLSICKRIAELHHADIQVVSVEGKGTTMTVHFPK